MALVKYGGGITQMSGSIAGNTFARNRFGNYTRSRTKPVNPRSSRQMGARVAIMFLAEQWRETPMTDAKRLAWEVYANSVNWENRLADKVKLTGFNMFIRANSVLLRIGASIVTDGPTDLGLPAGDPLFAISALSAATQDLTMTFDDTMDWHSETGSFFTMDLGEPQNPTRNFFGGPWRFSSTVSGNDADGVASPKAGCGNLPWTLIEGQKIWARASIIRKDGRVSTKFEPAPAVVGA